MVSQNRPRRGIGGVICHGAFGVGGKVEVGSRSAANNHVPSYLGIGVDGTKGLGR